MADKDWLAGQFEQHRAHLRGVAYRMLGSLSEADDAMQEAWLKLSRSDATGIENPGGWLTTVVARVCLDMLRTRKSRREDSFDPAVQEGEEIRRAAAGGTRPSDPEQETLLADSVGLALLVVLETLDPAERLALVLHDMFAVPFDEIATIVGRTPAAARQLASRARRRVQGGATTMRGGELARHREVVDAFLAALRAGDFEGLLAVLDPDLVVTTDIEAAAGGVREVHGAANWARGAITAARGARAARPALVNGDIGLIVAPRGRLFRALRFTFAGGRITQIEVIGDRARLDALELGVLDN